MKKRLLCGLLAAVLLFALLPAVSHPADAAEKPTVTRAIAIVFDNSGSMYMNGRDIWCKATYAMEVFGAMMNEGDTLYVYPMHPVTVDGKEYTSVSPLVINGPKEAAIVRNMVTPMAGGTPIESISNAHQSLKNMRADEKYLIVLTDGNSFHKNDDALSASRTKTELTNLLNDCSRDMQTLYLGIGSDAVIPTVKNSSQQYFLHAKSSANVLSMLTDMCNRIFGRDTLKVSGNEVKFDVSMSKLIIFAQGEGISNVNLSGGTKVSEHETKYSELGTSDSRYVNEQGIDRTLQGMLVTYENISAGTYNLSYSGNPSSVTVYYEPNVDLVVRFVDSTGKEVDPNADEVNSGTYRLEYGVVDAVTGEFTTSDLLGKTEYSMTYTINGKEYSFNDTKSGSREIELHAGDTITGNFTVRYLEDYTIRKTSESLGWPQTGLVVAARPAGEVKLEVTGGADRYDLSKLEEQAVYEVQVYYEGNLVSGSELDHTDLSVNLTGGNAKHEIKKTADGYTVTVKYSGDAASTTCGDYTISFTGTYLTTENQTGTSPAVSKTFTLEDDSKGLRAEFRMETDYFLIGKLADEPPIYLELVFDGAPLTQAEFNATSVSVDMADLAYDIQPDPSNSRYIITLTPGNSIEKGKRDIRAVITGRDAVGREVTDDATATINLQNLPVGIRILIILLIIAAIVTAIWLILNIKVLPKNITIDTHDFVVGFNHIEGEPECNYTTSGLFRNRGTLEISCPSYSANHNVACGVYMNLTAVSPLRMKSSRRKAEATDIEASYPANTRTVRMPGLNMAPTPEGTLNRIGARQQEVLTTALDDGSQITITASCRNRTNTGNVNFNFRATLHFE